MNADVLSRTRSLCPVCLKTLDAAIVREPGSDAAYIRRTCPEHGEFSGLIWKGEPSLESWSRPKGISRTVQRETQTRLGCPHDCGRCPEHGQNACTVLFEITGRCDLRCPVCFADAGGNASPFTPLSVLTEQLQWIKEHAGEVVLQISGGEPTLHPDLIPLVRAGRTLFPAVQLNTNGLSLAERPELARELAEAGLSWVFLQFDGTTDDIFTALRGKPLLERKLAAVKHCGQAGLSVVLVPTVAAGVNDGDLGNLARLALSLAPTVRGLHIQPMTGSGRNSLADALPPITLPQVLQALSEQSGGQIRPEHATPPGCEHERCSFHCRYRISPSGSLIPLRGDGPCCPSSDQGASPAACCSGLEDSAPPGMLANMPEDALGGARRAIEVILRAWQGPPGSEGQDRGSRAAPDAFDAFITQARIRTFSVTCMAFQDAWNVDLARLKGCCVHVFMPPDRLIPFCACNMTALDGTPLHRRKHDGPGPV